MKNNKGDRELGGLQSSISFQGSITERFPLNKGLKEMRSELWKYVGWDYSRQQKEQVLAS